MQPSTLQCDYRCGCFTARGCRPVSTVVVGSTPAYRFVLFGTPKTVHHRADFQAGVDAKPPCS